VELLGAHQMTLHYHGTPITPRSELLALAGRCFCVSYAKPQDVKVCHEIGQSVMLDNGAFSFWRTGKQTDWKGYYAWAEEWLAYNTTWAVIPDVIGGTEQENDQLIEEWSLPRGLPVWHMHERLIRLRKLIASHKAVCFGSSAQYAQVGSDLWRRRADEAFNAIVKENGSVPWVHMLRGMGLSGSEYPFASVDSTDLARNHAGSSTRAARAVNDIADRWDSLQNAPTWQVRHQLKMEEIAA